MSKLARLLLCGSLLGAALQAQVEQLATSGDGGILLFHSRFRLQSETDLGAQGKIYRWEDGAWTLLAAARDVGFGVLPDVFGPFISTDGKVRGWQTGVGCFLCQIVVAPPFSSELSGIDLPDAFPRGTLRMSC